MWIGLCCVQLPLLMSALVQEECINDNIGRKAELSYQLAKTKGHLKSLLATASNQHLLAMLDQVNGELRELAHLNFPRKVLLLFFHSYCRSVNQMV